MGEHITNESAAARRPAHRTSDGALQALTLPNGIGYLALTHFWTLPSVAAELGATLRRLDGTAGLIIDLRTNDGGDPATASLLSSLLFDTEPAYLDEVHLSRLSRDAEPARVCPVRYHNPVVILLGRRSSALAWRFARNLADLDRVVLAGEVPAVAHGSVRMLDLHVHESAALRRARERLAQG